MSGAGKSTISKEISRLKEAEIIDADKIAKELQRKGEEYYKKIIESFGKDIITKERRNK